MTIIVNGEPRQAERGASIAAVLAVTFADLPRAGVAVALNGEVIPRAVWESTEVRDDDRVEVLHAIGGG